jgi:prepilin-type processing-associated H-X9-DG protein
MLAEEPGSTNRNENAIGDKVINDGRWLPGQPLPLTIRHGGKADVTFTDGHVQPVTPDFGDDEANSRPDL